MSGNERVNTALRGSGRIDDIKGHQQGEIRGQTKLVKINDVTEYATGWKEESAEFLGKGAEVYTKA